MKRRTFIAGLGGAAVLPWVARAQQGGRVRRIGVLMRFGENDPEPKRRISAFTQALADLGWTVGRNVRMDLDEARRKGLAQAVRRHVRAPGLVAALPEPIAEPPGVNGLP
jgi:hypothetical protein